METTITLQPNDLNAELLAMIRSLVSAKKITEITINLSDKKQAKILRKETPKQVKQRIEKAFSEIKKGNENLVSFTEDEFDKFSKTLAK